MIKVSVLYPNAADAQFDFDYYCNAHIPLIADLLGDALISGSADAGLAGGTPNEAPTYIAMGHLVFESVEVFQNSFAPHADKILADLANFTNTQPQIQISEIKL
ncbi:EthD family reductase [Pseudoalteromonas sp. Z9A5]|uniref:EthD family reductase n=1 Tax=Pseudoalteromonas sp. Z9A5 TaxID=2686355 RepID=UPI00140843D9|nr:EthD family reductase [Pseudoalteromonas sp. Z9A5]